MYTWPQGEPSSGLAKTIDTNTGTLINWYGAFPPNFIKLKKQIAEQRVKYNTPCVKKRFLKIAFAWECIKYLWKNSKLLVLLFVSGEENGPSREQTAEVLFLFFACGCIYYPEERKSKTKHMIWSGSLFKIYIITLAECT